MDATKNLLFDCSDYESGDDKSLYITLSLMNRRRENLGSKGLMVPKPSSAKIF